jgi:hypothetical protein
MFSQNQSRVELFPVQHDFHFHMFTISTCVSGALLSLLPSAAHVSFHILFIFVSQIRSQCGVACERVDLF